MTERRVRLDKLLVERGLGSRKAVQKLIRHGRVSVDGHPACKPNLQISTHTPIHFDEVLVDPLPTLLAWHKPVGVHSTYRDPWGRKGLDEALPLAWRAPFHPVGRLDAETSGLLLFGRDGRLTQWLLHPRRAIERTYNAVVEGCPDEAAVANLRSGVKTSEGVFRAEVLSVRDECIELVVREGRHRMVRRMLANVGHPVVKLHRLRYGPVCLGGLAASACRAINEAETRWLQAEGAPMPEI